VGDRATHAKQGVSGAYRKNPHKTYVAYVPELDLSICGESPDGARKNIRTQQAKKRLHRLKTPNVTMTVLGYLHEKAVSQNF
jgi:hypothetical protein